MTAALVPLFITVRWTDIVDILLVGVLIYQLYHIVKGTVAIKIFVGILSIYLLWKLFEALQMELLSEILGQFIGVGVIALIIVFQQELRRFLLIVGTTGLLSGKDGGKGFWPWSKANPGSYALNISTIVKACQRLAENHTGALIILTRVSDLQLYISSAEKLDAQLGQAILESIFFKNSPLHDGAIIISNNRIMAARCVLPITDREDFPIGLGTRHRAAAGISEISDAVGLIISEETGSIGYAINGMITQKVSPEQLEQFLRRDFA